MAQLKLHQLSDIDSYLDIWRLPFLGTVELQYASDKDIKQWIEWSALVVRNVVSK